MPDQSKKVQQVAAWVDDVVGIDTDKVIWGHTLQEEFASFLYDGPYELSAIERGEELTPLVNELAVKHIPLLEAVLVEWVFLPEQCVE